MRMALEPRAAASPSEVDYVNAHGTSTPAGDPVEIGAIRRLVGDDARRAALVSAPPSRCTATAWARPAASRPC